MVRAPSSGPIDGIEDTDLKEYVSGIFGHVQKCKTNKFQPPVRTNFALLHEVTMVGIIMHLCVGAIEIRTLLNKQVDVAAVSTTMCFLKPFLEIYRRVILKLSLLFG